MLPVYFLLFVLSLSACSDISSEKTVTVAEEDTALLPQNPPKVLNPDGKTIITRFNTPAGFVRVPADSLSFAYYLRHLPLKPNGAEVHLYNYLRTISILTESRNLANKHYEL